MAKVLVTDDAAFMRKMLRDILTKAGHSIVEADNGNEMLSTYKKEKPDLVLLDITMPEKDGITALKELHESYPDAKVVMCSAMGQQAMVLDAIKYGASDFVVKPFVANRVIEAVDKMVR